MERDQFFHVIAFGEDHFHRNAITLTDGLHHAIGLVGEASGIQREDTDTSRDP